MAARFAGGGRIRGSTRGVDRGACAAGACSRAGRFGSEWLHRFDKPLLALIEGFCIGGGLVVALCADVRFATPASRFAIPAARLGLGYEYSGVAALARLIGPSATRDLLFSARQVEPDEALRLGLINFVVAGDQIEARRLRFDDHASVRM